MENNAGIWKNIRLKLRFTQTEFAEKLGISRQTWIKYEKSDTAPLYIHHAVNWLNNIYK